MCCHSNRRDNSMTVWLFIDWTVCWGLVCLVEACDPEAMVILYTTECAFLCYSKCTLIYIQRKNWELVETLVQTIYLCSIPHREKRQRLKKKKSLIILYVCLGAIWIWIILLLLNITRVLGLCRRLSRKNLRYRQSIASLKSIWPLYFQSNQEPLF